MKMTTADIQINLRKFMGDDIKPGTKKGLLVEHTYIRALVDAGVEIPVITAMTIAAGRSIVTFPYDKIVQN